MIRFLLNFPAPDSRTVKRGTGSPQDESGRPADKMAAPPEP
jgi:hypothetical protein